MRLKLYLKRCFLGLFFIVIIGFLIPQNFKMPVRDATKASYSQDSFWFYPWGKSVTHKGVDIFAPKKTPLHSATAGIVVYTGNIDLGGKVVYVLGPKWRLHYYAHLEDIQTSTFSLVSHNSVIGSVGNSGNAAGKSPHLHYAIKTLFPYFWRIDQSKQGWKKMIFLNPIEYLNAYFESK